MIGLMGVCIACGSSPIEEKDREQNAEQPDLKNMVLIPAGEFLMGSKEGEGAFDEHPQHTVYLDAYYIDKYEVVRNFKSLLRRRDMSRMQSGKVKENLESKGAGPEQAKIL